MQLPRTEIRSAHTGVIESVIQLPNDLYKITVRESDISFSSYWHVTQPTVDVGEHVTPGMILGFA